MSKEIKTLYPNANIIGNNTPPRSGSFEITLNGEIVYSKFETNTFPTKHELKNILNV